MSPRIKNAFLLLLLVSGAGVLWRWLFWGDFYIERKWLNNVRYFFDLNSNFIENIIGTMKFLGFILGCWWVYSKLYDWVEQIAFIKNTINKAIPIIWLLLCVFWINGNFITYNYVGLELDDTTEKLTKRTLVLADDKSIENLEDRIEIIVREHANDEFHIDRVIKHRFMFAPAAVWETFHFNNEYKGFGGYILCMISNFLENLIFILITFTAPMAVFIIFREIEYKK